MIRVVLFASLREQLGVAELDVDSRSVATVAELVDTLAAEHGERWKAQLLGDSNLIAVNQELTTVDAPLSAGDEVAFLPPVTGG